MPQDGCTYVLTSATPKSTHPITGHATINQVSFNKGVSLFLVCPIKLDNLTNPSPLDMAPLLHNFSYLFTKPMGLPPSFSTKHMIDLIPGASLPNSPSYRLTPQEATGIEHQSRQLLESGNIQPSSSPYASPTFIFPKKENYKWHLMTDYCTLNEATIKNHYPLPRIEDLLDHLQGDCFFTKMDLTSRWNQVCMHVVDTWKTSFMTRFGIFEWLVMLFGLTNAPNTFMWLINDICRPHLGKIVVSYLNDIMVFNKSWAEHI